LTERTLGKHYRAITSVQIKTRLFGDLLYLHNQESVHLCAA